MSLEGNLLAVAANQANSKGVANSDAGQATLYQLGNATDEWTQVTASIPRWTQVTASARRPCLDCSHH